MLGVKYGIAALAMVLTGCIFTATAEATYRGCGFDRYGYHPPNFRGCYAVEIVEVPPPVVRVAVPVVRVKRPRRVVRKPARRVHRARPVRKVVAFVPPPLPPPPAPPFEGYYAAEPLMPGCYYDNGYDLQVHRICYHGW